MRAQLLRPGGLDAPQTPSACSTSYAAFRSLDARHPRRRRRRRASSREYRPRPRAGHPHRRAALARLGGLASRRPTSASTPTARSTCSRRRGDTRPTRPSSSRSTNKVYGDTPEPPAARRARRRGSSCPRTTPTSTASTPRCRSTRRMHSLFGVSKAAADLLVQEYGRYFDMPTVCFRGGCLTGPQHAGAELHGFLAYLMQCTVTGDAVHGLRLRRQAGARQHPQRRPRRAPSPLFHAQPRAGGRLQHRRRPRVSNCSMLEAIALCERIAGRELDWSARRRGADRRPPLVDQRPRRVPAPTTRTGRRRIDIEDDPARDPRRERRALGAPRSRHEALGRHPGAQRGGLDRRDGRGHRRRARARARSTTRSSSSTTRARDGTAGAVARDRRDATRACAACRSHYRPASASPSAPASSVFKGDAVAIVMADGSDDPEDLVALPRACSRRATTAPSARASCAAPRSRDYPRVEADASTGSSTGHPRRSSATATTTRRTPSRPTGARSSRTSSRCSRNHFNLTVELPLKAIVRGHSYAIVPDLLAQPPLRRVEAALQEMGSRYLFIVLYVLFEHHLSRGDYYRGGFEGWQSHRLRPARIAPETPRLVAGGR